MKTTIDLNVSGLEFPVIECKHFEDAYDDLKKRVSKAMDRKDYGVSQHIVWDSCYDFNYTVEYLPESRTQDGYSHREYFISKNHKAPYSIFACSVGAEVMKINGEQFTSTKELESVKKSIKTVYDNWRQAWKWAFDDGQDILDEICQRGKYAPEREVA